MKDLISMRNLGREDILYFLEIARRIESKEIVPDLSDKVAALLFFEPSTRTVFSFDTAIKRLNGKSLIMLGAEGSSVKKGETFADTIRTISQYVDIFIIRSVVEGASRYASQLVEQPVVNAGDGSNQHPTQTLLDLYSIQKTQGSLENLKIALVGDLKFGRTIHSLVYGLAPFNPTFYLIAPRHLGLPEYIRTDTALKHITFEERNKIDDVVEEIDIMYVTRIQKERFTDPEDYEKVKDAYQITRELIDNSSPKSNMKIMHPLPRVNEISPLVDDTPYAYYFQQAKNGLWIRQAIVSILLGKVA
jgi:aspartate carbamoyltransferase catalytic subunit